MYQRTTLGNGIRVLTSTMPHVRSVSVCFFFGVGSRYERAELSGVSHLIEHMLFKGTRAYPTARLISEAIEGVGGVLDAETGKELTVYSTKTASEHLDLSLGLLADMARHPVMDPIELEKERRVIIEELAMYRDSPQEWVGVLGEETFWPNLPLGREVAGARETVESIQLAALQEYRTSHYVPGNLVVSVAGDIEHEAMVARVERLLGDWGPRVAPAYLPCPPPRDVPRVKLENRRTEQTNLVLYTLGLRHDDPAYYALVLLNAVLGDGMASRLFIGVREERGLAYDVSSSPVTYHDTGAFAVYAGVEPRRTGAALEAILQELGRLKLEPVGVEELRRAKEYTKGRMALRLEDTHSVASWLGGQDALLGEIRDLDETLALVEAVTADQIRELANRLFTDEFLRMAIIGPHKQDMQFERMLHV